MVEARDLRCSLARTLTKQLPRLAKQGIAVGADQANEFASLLLGDPGFR